MDVTSAKVIRIILLVIACILLPFGIVRASETTEHVQQAAYYNGERVVAELVGVESKDTGFTRDGYKKRVEFTYNIINNTSDTLDKVTVETVVTDGMGNYIGKITHTFGKSSSEGFRILPWQTARYTVYVERAREVEAEDGTDFFEKLYTGGITNRKTQTTVSSAHWTAGS